MVDST